MKAFKEWWKNLLCSNNENFRVIAELSWERALKEVLKQIDTSNSDRSETIQIKQRRQTIDWIKEELRDE